jgi:hypothetical protein
MKISIYAPYAKERFKTARQHSILHPERIVEVYRLRGLMKCGLCGLTNIGIANRRPMQKRSRCSSGWRQNLATASATRSG